jgi:hypothetical protein
VSDRFRIAGNLLGTVNNEAERKLRKRREGCDDGGGEGDR